ncbi:hypothetical protein FSW04_14045 [Baekduia soli]|uniref:Uncharacterized protein n=1 Tax=Baekduia soli TaxID=496014 RepID=A0A5B8U6M0_9ACTN|nr:hypothetical protein [Baekduia soli]QEC48581.1 hypothetical protein FSW04_14045 [Baekduia soli]
MKMLKGRLAEIEKTIGPLVAEAEGLRDAIARIDGNGGTATPTAPRGRRGAGGAGPSKRRVSTRRTPSGRAPRGANREAILKAIAGESKTAGQVATETGIGRGTVASTLTKLVNDGRATKASRGYQASSAREAAGGPRVAR